MAAIMSLAFGLLLFAVGSGVITMHVKAIMITMTVFMVLFGLYISWPFKTEKSFLTGLCAILAVMLVMGGALKFNSLRWACIGQLILGTVAMTIPSFMKRRTSKGFFILMVISGLLCLITSGDNPFVTKEFFWCTWGLLALAVLGFSILLIIDGVRTVHQWYGDDREIPTATDLKEAFEKVFYQDVPDPEACLVLNNVGIDITNVEIAFQELINLGVFEFVPESQIPEEMVKHEEVCDDEDSPQVTISGIVEMLRQNAETREAEPESKSYADYSVRSNGWLSILVGVCFLFVTVLMVLSYFKLWSW